MRYVILRDDDTNALTPPAYLERLYRPFLDRGLPVNLATIPDVRSDVRTPDQKLEGFITAGRPSTRAHEPIAGNQELIDYLRSESGYRIVHHGCHHDYFEFGDTNRTQLADRLDYGAQRLKEAGLDATSAFVAPYDKLSREAYLEVASRFPVISTGWFEAGRIPRSWWPAYAGKKVTRRRHWRAGRTALLSHPGCILSYHRPMGEIFPGVRQAVESSQLTVLVTHWWEYFREGKADEKFIDVLHEVAAWLGERKDVRVVSFSDVATGAVPLN